MKNNRVSINLGFYDIWDILNPSKYLYLKLRLDLLDRSLSCYRWRTKFYHPWLVEYFDYDGSRQDSGHTYRDRGWYGQSDTLTKKIYQHVRKPDIGFFTNSFTQDKDITRYLFINLVSSDDMYSVSKGPCEYQENVNHVSRRIFRKRNFFFFSWKHKGNKINKQTNK